MAQLGMSRWAEDDLQVPLVPMATTLLQGLHLSLAAPLLVKQPAPRSLGMRVCRAPTFIPDPLMAPQLMHVAVKVRMQSRASEHQLFPPPAVTCTGI